MTTKKKVRAKKKPTAKPAATHGEIYVSKLYKDRGVTVKEEEGETEISPCVAAGFAVGFFLALTFFFVVMIFHAP